MCLQNLIKFCQFILKIGSNTQILESIKGRNSVANLRKTTIYNTNIDLVNDAVYTKFVHLWKKKLQKSSSPEPVDLFLQNLVCSIWDSCLSWFVQMMTVGWLWPILQQGLIL